MSLLLGRIEASSKSWCKVMEPAKTKNCHNVEKEQNTGVYCVYNRKWLQKDFSNPVRSEISTKSVSKRAGRLHQSGLDVRLRASRLAEWRPCWG